MINVVIVDDSISARDNLEYILSSDQEINIIAKLKNGLEAIKFINECEEKNIPLPDLITMDLIMPLMDGLNTIKLIMQNNPMPIVVISSKLNNDENDMTYESLAAGAVSVLEKPKSVGSDNFEIVKNKIIEEVKNNASIKVIRRSEYYYKEKEKEKEKNKLNNKDKFIEIPKINIIAIGVSTGGPIVLKEILSSLSSNFPVPIIIVQHIAEGFLEGFVDWLNNNTAINIKIAQENEKIISGNVYFAPEKYHLGLKDQDTIMLSNEKPQNGLRPAVSYLFKSICNICPENCLAMLLTGMGNDGVHQLKKLKEKGAITIAQDKDSCVVNGMPGEAIKIGAVKYIFSPSEISRKLKSLEELK